MKWSSFSRVNICVSRLPVSACTVCDAPSVFYQNIFERIQSGESSFRMHFQFLWLSCNAARLAYRVIVSVLMVRKIGNSMTRLITKLQSNRKAQSPLSLSNLSFPLFGKPERVRTRCRRLSHYKTVIFHDICTIWMARNHTSLQLSLPFHFSIFTVRHQLGWGIHCICSDFIICCPHSKRRSAIGEFIIKLWRISISPSQQNSHLHVISVFISF